MKRFRLSKKYLISLGIIFILSFPLVIGSIITHSFFIKTPIKSFSTPGAIEPVSKGINVEYEKWEELPYKEKESSISPVPYVITSNGTESQFQIDNVSASITDSMFDLRNDEGFNNVTSVKNQEDTVWCSWFQANAILESSILKKYQKTYDFSERYSRYAMVRYFLDGQLNPLGFNEYATEGANYYKTSALLSSRRGPINEIDMPFVNSMERIDINLIQNKNVSAYVENIKIFPGYVSKDLEMINSMKYHLINYGALGIGFFYDYNYHNFLTNAYYYPVESTNLNHAAVIVGWDDNYATTNFKNGNQPPNSGAWIVKNSWGESWGDGGYFYISYDDYRVYTQVYGIVDVAIDKNYDNSYYYDPLGWVGAFGYSTYEPVYAANKYVKKTEGLELLSEVTIGTLGVTNYQLYINNIDSVLTSSNMKLIKEGNLGYAGYHTVKLDEPLLLENLDFSIIVRYQVDNYQYPVPLQTSFSASPGYSYSGYRANQSFTSLNKVDWYDLYDKEEKSAASIKAFTKTVDFNIGDIITNPSPIYDQSSGDITIPINSYNIVDSSLYEVKITSSEDIDVTDQFIITKTEIINNTSNIILNYSGSLNDGDYNIEVSYYSLSKNKTFTLNNFININDISITGDLTYIKKDKTYQIDYAVLPNNATNKLLDFTSSNPNIATVDENGIVTAVSEGEVIISISSTDGSNITKTQTLNIIDYNYTTDYTIDGDYLINIAKATEYSTFINKFQLNSLTIKVLDFQSNEITSGYIGTGMKINILYDSYIVENYDAVVTGDVNGDGLIKSIDLSQMRLHLAGVIGYTKEKAYFKALDINLSATVTSIDLSQLRLLIANG